MLALGNGAAAVVMVVEVMLSLVHVGVLHTPVLGMLAVCLVVTPGVVGGSLVVGIVLVMRATVGAHLGFCSELRDVVCRGSGSRLGRRDGGGASSLDLIVVVGDVVKDKFVSIEDSGRGLLAEPLLLLHKHWGSDH